MLFLQVQGSLFKPRLCVDCSELNHHTPPITVLSSAGSEAKIFARAVPPHPQHTTLHFTFQESIAIPDLNSALAPFTLDQAPATVWSQVLTKNLVLVRKIVGQRDEIHPSMIVPLCIPGQKGYSIRSHRGGLWAFSNTMIESPIQYVTPMARRSVSVAAAMC